MQTGATQVESKLEDTNLKAKTQTHNQKSQQITNNQTNNNLHLVQITYRVMVVSGGLRWTTTLALLKTQEGNKSGRKIGQAIPDGS